MNEVYDAMVAEKELRAKKLVQKVQLKSKFRRADKPKKRYQRKAGRIEVYRLDSGRVVPLDS